MPRRRRTLVSLVLYSVIPQKKVLAFPSCGGLFTCRLLSRAAVKRGGGCSGAGGRVLCSSSRSSGGERAGEDSADDAEGDSLFPDTLGREAPAGVTPEKWRRVLRSTRDRQAEGDRLSPSPDHSPGHVAAVTLQALRQNDVPYPNFGCEVAIRFSSTTNPASGFTPGGMRTYIDDPSMPFYRVLDDWDEMAPVGDAEIDAAETGKANQQIRVRKDGDPTWSTVSMDFVREDGCWLIERLWIDDKRTAGGGTGGGESPTPARLTVDELFDQDRLDIMGCRLADYDPACIMAEGGDWLEERPNPSLSPKAVALTCILSLRHNDDGSGGGDAAAPEASSPGTAKRRLNQGCERVIRFCSPTNVASTLTPAHFAQYLNEPWYAIFKEWDELAFHSEEISADGDTADLVVLLRPEDEEAWTSVSWELVKCEDMWLTERIWVVDV